MDVIDRYVRTLRVLLPKDKRDDIVRELSEEIHSQVAEREAALGRSLDAQEQAAIVGQYGHPLVTAARYRPQRHLIGPVVFPYYWIALKTMLTLVAMGHAIGAVVMLVGGTPLGQMGPVLENGIGTALKVAAWLTMISAFADFQLSRSDALKRSSPLSPLPSHVQRAVGEAREHLPGFRVDRPASAVSWTGTKEPPISRLVFSLVLSVWWLAGLRFPALFFGPGAEGLEWGHAMDRLYPVLVVAQLTMLAEQFVGSTRSGQAGLFRVTRFVWLVAGSALIYLVATSDGQWMAWRPDSAARGDAIVMRLAGREISLVEFVNYVWSIVFAVVTVLSLWGILKGLFGRLRGTPITAHA